MKKSSMAIPATLLPLVLAVGHGVLQGRSGQQAAVEDEGEVSVDTLSACPNSGNAEPGSAHALANELKRRLPAGGAPTLLTFDDFQILQKEADDSADVGEGRELDDSQRRALHQLAYSHGTVSEGDPVGVSGFLVGSAHPNRSGESVNCGLKGSANNDFHIPIAPTADSTEFDGLVVEMIPQNRPAQWNVTKIHKVQKLGLKVFVTGQLFYDNQHFVNDDEDNPKGGQPKRFTLFEVHPVTQLAVCKNSDSCDETKPDQWTALENWQPTT
jgi:hypothetical protein